MSWISVKIRNRETNKFYDAEVLEESSRNEGYGNYYRVKYTDGSEDTLHTRFICWNETDLQLAKEEVYRKSLEGRKELVRDLIRACDKQKEELLLELKELK